MKTKIIPFDLETAKEIQDGKIKGKIKTQDGFEVRIICWDRINEHRTPIVALVDNKQREELYFYSEAGEYDFGSNPMLNLVLEVPDNEPQFKQFDKVLVRDISGQWSAAYYSHYDKEEDKHSCGGVLFDECIPYDEHLVGITDNPNS